MYDSIDDDRDWRRLTPLAKATFETLKRKLGQYGVNILPVESLPKIINCSSDDLERALAELEAPKPGKPYGWIRREEDVVWLVNGLKFEPSITLTNKNHKAATIRHGEQLLALTGLHVVHDFMAYYGLSRTQTSSHQLSHIDGSGDGIVRPSPRGTPMDGGITETDTESDTESESDTRAHAREAAKVSAAAPPVSLTEALAALPADAIAFLREFYPRSRTEKTRREDVARQIVATLNGGTPLRRGQIVYAYTAERLAARCRDVIREGVTDPDKAIVVLLLKLGDTTDVTEQAARAAAEQRQAEEYDTAAELIAAEDWLAEQPLIEASIDAELERQGCAAVADESEPEQRFQATCRRFVRTSLVLEAWRLAKRANPETP
jgi:hypothetical protein